jgi:hypothetical protein
MGRCAVAGTVHCSAASMRDPLHRRTLTDVPLLDGDDRHHGPFFKASTNCINRIVQAVEEEVKSRTKKTLSIEDADASVTILHMPPVRDLVGRHVKRRMVVLVPHEAWTNPPSTLTATAETTDMVDTSTTRSGSTGAMQRTTHGSEAPRK